MAGPRPAGADRVWVVEPRPSDWLKGLPGLNLNALPPDPALVLVAVKPQMMAEALPALAAPGNGETVFLSIAAGIPIGPISTCWARGPRSSGRCRTRRPRSVRASLR